MLIGQWFTKGSMLVIAALLFLTVTAMFIATKFFLDSSCKMYYTAYQSKSTAAAVGRSDTRILGLSLRAEAVNTNIADNTGVQEATDIFFGFISRRHYDCEDYVRLGNQGDGGWNACIVGLFALKKPCLIYSFGINNDFSFDDVASIKFDCTVRAFDPSMKTDDHRRSPNIYFYRLGLAGSDRQQGNGWKMRSLPSIVKALNDTDKTIDLLKMDIEGSEWEVLQSFLSSPEAYNLVTKRVRQIALEIHPGKFQVSSARQQLEKLNGFEQKLGFRRWSFSVNTYCGYVHLGTPRSECYEMVYLNKQFIRQQDLKV